MISSKPRRLAIAFFYDKDGVVDDYYPAFIRGLSSHVEKTVFVSNGPLEKHSELKVTACVDKVMIRQNKGFDAWAYKEAIDTLGAQELSQFDELILYNHTNYGPIFPFAEMFETMEKRDCDFWGITDHAEVSPNPFGVSGSLPRHINSHFIVVRKPMLTSLAFGDYWKRLPEINSYADAVLRHESVFTKHFEDLNYKCSVYLPSAEFGSRYPLMEEPDAMLLRRCPIVKRRMFFGDTAYLELSGSDATRALDIIASSSDYDPALMWRNAIRSSKLRALNTNVTLLSILPDIAEKPMKEYGKIAVCAHIYYLDMLPEVLCYTGNIPVPYDFIATTNTEAKRDALESALAKAPGVRKAIVRVVEQNRGRDMSALFITCRDLFLDDRYDFVCRVHTKKTPQVDAPRGNLFKRHMFANLLNSRGYVTNLLNKMVDNPWVGLVIPPIVQISFYTLGHSWYSNQSRSFEIADRLKLKVNFDDTTPVAPYGTMFWFRPPALRKLFVHEWKWNEFAKEPNHVDGSLAHAMERIIAYVAQDAGFTTEHVANSRIAAQNYTILEYKVDQLSSALPANTIQGQRNIIRQLIEKGGIAPSGIKHSLRQLAKAVLASYRFRVLRRR